MSSPSYLLHQVRGRSAEAEHPRRHVARKAPRRYKGSNHAGECVIVSVCLLCVYVSTSQPTHPSLQSPTRSTRLTRLALSNPPHPLFSLCSLPTPANAPFAPRVRRPAPSFLAPYEVRDRTRGADGRQSQADQSRRIDHRDRRRREPDRVRHGRRRVKRRTCWPHGAHRRSTSARRSVPHWRSGPGGGQDCVRPGSHVLIGRPRNTQPHGICSSAGRSSSYGLGGPARRPVPHGSSGGVPPGRGRDQVGGRPPAAKGAADDGVDARQHQ